MLIGLGRARARPGHRDELLEAMRAVAAPARTDAGCHGYGFYADIEDTDVIVSVEVWADRAALDAHMSHDHTLTFLRRVPRLVHGEPVMELYEAAATAP